jgi:hypothetical protein
MNFPVASVLIHSVNKPEGGGRLSATEFWNIAGRAGRVGLADEGLVVFANEKAEETCNQYRRHLNAAVVSALLQALDQGIPEDPKEAYQQVEELRPFLQFVAHAVVTLGYRQAVDQFEETLQASLAFYAAGSRERTAPLRALARRYLELLRDQQAGMLEMADQSGLGSFSFNNLYALVRGDRLLEAGPGAVLRSGVDGLTHLVDALKVLPEMDLAVGKGEGVMDAAAVARVAARWMAGEPVYASSMEFTGKDEAERVRKAGAYVHSKVSSILSWGAHAYARSHTLVGSEDQAPADRMLPAYLQHGVDSPEAAVAALVGLPRPLARAAGELWRERKGRLQPGQARELRDFVEGADLGTYADLVERSSWRGAVRPEDAATVVRGMMGRRG